MAGNWIGDRLLQAGRAAPLIGWPHPLVATDLIHAPVYLQVVAVGVQELHRDLRSGSPPAFKHDRHLMAAQMIAGAEDFIQGGDLKGEMVQLVPLPGTWRAAYQRNPMMVGVEAHEDHTVRRQLLGVYIGDFHPQHFGIKTRGTLQVGYPQDHVTNLLKVERLGLRGRQSLDFVNLDHDGSSPLGSLIKPPACQSGSGRFVPRHYAALTLAGANGAGPGLTMQREGKAMKAIVIREFGPPEVMRLEEVPTPVPGAHDVLIEVHAVSVNQTLDLIARSGRYPVPIGLPHVLGVDPSGVIVAVGAQVGMRQVGDRVVVSSRLSRPDQPPRLLGVHEWGGYAQYVAVPAVNTYLVPDAIDFPTATVVARHAPLAFGLLRDEARLQPGQWVLVMGAAGGLGSAGVQVAKHLGARVIAAAGAQERVASAIALGADHGINYRAEELTVRVRELTGGRGVDVVFENIGAADLFPQALASLARDGRLVTAGSHGGGIVPLDVSRLYMQNLTVIGSTRQNPADIELSLQIAARGHYRVLIDRVMPLAQAIEAHRWVEGRTGLGKVVLVPHSSSNRSGS